MQYRFITRTAEIVNHIIKILRQAYQSGKPHEIIIREYDAKSREQEEKYHAMIGDISRQMRYHGRKAGQGILEKTVGRSLCPCHAGKRAASGKQCPIRSVDRHVC